MRRTSFRWSPILGRSPNRRAVERDRAQQTLGCGWHILSPWQTRVLRRRFPRRELIDSRSYAKPSGWNG
jgi:hypothetical protein